MSSAESTITSPIATMSEYGAFWTDYRDLLTVYKASLAKYRALLTECRALVAIYRALLGVGDLLQGSFGSKKDLTDMVKFQKSHGIPILDAQH